jgi:hypothetical protein
MKRNVNYNSLKNLPQYRGKSDEELAEILRTREERVENKKTDSIETLEEKILEKLEEFILDYDISDLKYNDKETLRSMMIALINLEDLDMQSFEITAGGVDHDNLNLLDKINSMSSKLRSDISKMQDDLKISRKIRKSNKEESVITYLEDLRVKAKAFAESRMSYVFCPSCNMLLSTLWVLYTEEKKNVLILKCNRKLQDGEICGEIVKINLADLAEDKTNKPGLLPESL